MDQGVLKLIANKFKVTSTLLISTTYLLLITTNLVQAQNAPPSTIPPLPPEFPPDEPETLPPLEE